MKDLKFCKLGMQQGRIAHESFLLMGFLSSYKKHSVYVTCLDFIVRLSKRPHKLRSYVENNVQYCTVSKNSLKYRKTVLTTDSLLDR